MFSVLDSQAGIYGQASYRRFLGDAFRTLPNMLWPLHAPMTRLLTLSHVLSHVMAFVLLMPVSQAAISTTGDVNPAYPGTAPDPWDAGPLSVGDTASGTLSINSGSRVTSEDATLGGSGLGVLGTVEVVGSGTTWQDSLDISLGGPSLGGGLLRVLQGAVVESLGGSVGHNNGSGAVEVDGQGSQWINTEDLFVGNLSTGELTISQQGMVRSRSSWIGLNVGVTGTVTVDGQQSRWEMQESLRLGEESNSGTATLSLTGSGSRVYVGAAAPLAGAALPVSETALIVADTVPSTAILAVYNGNSLLNGGNAYIASDSGQFGAALIAGNGSIWSNGGSVTIGSNTVGGAGSGTLSLEKLGQVSAASGVDVGLSGSLLGNGTVAADLVSGGQVAPGLSTINPAIGSLSITGNYLQAAAGRLQVELAGTASGQWDTIAIGGSAALDGTLEVLLDSPGGTPFAPQLGNSFEVLTATGGLTGIFSGPLLPTLDTGLGWLLDYGANSLTLTVIPSLAADFNFDGKVNSLDLAIWETNYPTASGAIKATGDANLDSDSDGADFLIWQLQFGSTVLPTVSSQSFATVPEPSAGLLGLFAMALVNVARLARRSHSSMLGNRS